MSLFKDNSGKLDRVSDEIVKVDQAPDEGQETSRMINPQYPAMPGSRFFDQMDVQHVHRPRFGRRL